MSARVCIDARIVPGEVGGVEQVILGLAGGFADLDLGEVQITFLASREMAEELRPLLKDNPALTCRVPAEVKKRKMSSSMDRLLGEGVSQGLQYVLYKLIGDKLIKIPEESDVVPDQFDLFHFPVQSAFSTTKPNIYHPHDLQHIHLPQYFSRLAYRVREFKYRAFCRQATVVAVASTWIKQDLIQNYNLADSKIRVVPLAPPTKHYDVPDNKQLEEIAGRLSLPDRFIFYPAQTWPHKNHLSLIRAVSRIRDQHGLIVPLVFSGKVTQFRQEIQSEIDNLGLSDSVQFLGFVSPIELQALYRLCTAVVIPSLYEAASFPLWEAYLAGAATACAATTSLPRQAADASIIFDPNDCDDIAQAVYRLWSDGNLRSRLIKKGRSRLAEFDWKLTCTNFLAIYRSILNLDLSQGERDLLSSEPCI